MVEKCDICGQTLNLNEGEDFFVETQDGSLVLCETHWIEYEKK